MIQEKWKSGHLDVSKSCQLGDNKLVIQFSSEYNTDGDGLQSTITSSGK